MKFNLFIISFTLVLFLMSGFDYVVLLGTSIIAAVVMLGNYLDQKDKHHAQES